MPEIERGTVDWVTDFDGGLVSFAAPYKHVSPAQAQLAIEAEAEILAEKRRLEAGFHRLGALIDRFDREQLYLGRGVPTLWDWVEEIGLSRRLVLDLLRITREVVPLLARRLPESVAPDDVLVGIGITKTRDLLPLLNDLDGEDKFLVGLDQATRLSSRALREEVKELRGVAVSHDEGYAALFKLRVWSGEEWNRVRMSCLKGTDRYECGDLRVMREDMPRLEALFKGFVEYATA